MCRAYSMPCTSVQPTIQARATKYVWRKITHNNYPIGFESTPIMYAVTIIGEAYSYTTQQMREVEIQRVFSTYHPSIAVGMAVTNFMRDYEQPSIRKIEVLKRVEK